MSDTSPLAATPLEDVVAELYKRLQSTLVRLSAHVEAHGMLDPREDETLAIGSVALLQARESGLIDEDGRFNDMMGIVPLDDETRSVSDTSLVDAMIAAGTEVLDRVDHDNANYVSGVTTDWDQGMVAVAVYRAMTRSSRERDYACALEIDRADQVVVQATSPLDAARVYAMQTFHAHEGEWMGGTVMVLQMPLGDAPNEELFRVVGGRFDTDIRFPADRDAYATAVPLAR